MDEIPGYETEGTRSEPQVMAPPPTAPSAPPPIPRPGVSGRMAALLAAVMLLIGLASGLILGGTGGFLLGRGTAEGCPEPAAAASTDATEKSRAQAQTGASRDEATRGGGEPSVAESPALDPFEGYPGLGDGTPTIHILPLDPDDPDFLRLMELLPPELRERYEDYFESLPEVEQQGESDSAGTPDA